jgi:integrase
MELLGHSQMRTTMDIYSHAIPALAREAVDRMGTVLLMRPASTATRDDSGRPPVGERPVRSGGAEGTRTPDPHTARAAGKGFCRSMEVRLPRSARHAVPSDLP